LALCVIGEHLRRSGSAAGGNTAEGYLPNFPSIILAACAFGSSDCGKTSFKH